MKRFCVHYIEEGVFKSVETNKVHLNLGTHLGVKYRFWPEYVQAIISCICQKFDKYISLYALVFSL